jgi:acyl transferase domain-containing protein
VRILSDEQPQESRFMSASLAFVFPGQGSQALGMLAEHGAQQPLIIDTFAEASSVPWVTICGHFVSKVQRINSIRPTRLSRPF